VNIDEHLSGLEDAGQRLAAAAAAAGLDAAVPSCPDWVVRDLVRHQGGIHRWATSYVSAPRTEMWDVDLDDVVGSWPADPDLLGWFTDGHAALLEALRNASPDLVCWTFLAAPSPLAMWSRRQAHETTIHRVDAELAAGQVPAAVPPDFAADGVDELLSCFITRPGGRLRADPARVLRVSCTDAAGDWLVAIGPSGVTTTAADGKGGASRQAAEADCHVRGGASDLYLALWNRQPAAELSTDGDTEVLDLFSDRVKVRWR
jgi:uncharacterized protein (TIGR03083 family)